MDAVAAVDLGATSGRVIVGYVGHNELRMLPVARFPNTPVTVPEGDTSALHWNILELQRSLTAGLASAHRAEPDISSIGVDSWAVDYALLTAGRMTQTPYHYRDSRTEGGVAAVHSRITPAELYTKNGLQHLPFNTVFQLAADAASGALATADRVLLIPDLISYWLTGVAATEITNASTTGLLDPRTRSWDSDLFRTLDLRESLFAPLVQPGETIGQLLPGIAAELGMSPLTRVTAVGSHDTASAIVAVPAAEENFAYISSGTWSLVGVETERPIISAAGREANFTNEGGVDGRIRYLKNVSGLWLLSESIRTWEKQSDQIIDLTALLREAEAVPGPIITFDPADERFISPGDMPARIADWYSQHDLPAPHSRAEFVRRILESLAHAYAVTLEEASRLSSTRIDTIHIIGGGSQNELLCQLTADHTGLPVLAGPTEATAIGNIMVQARASGIVAGSLEALRSIVRNAFPPIRYQPRPRRP